MENVKHTPGPWVVSDHDDNGDVVVRTDSDGIIVCNCSEERWGDITKPEAVANAALIAASPEMLNALEMIAEAGIDFQAGKRDGATMGILSGCIDKAREAIAKAEGK